MKDRPKLIGYAFAVLAVVVALTLYAGLVEEAVRHVHNLSMAATPPIGTIAWLVSIPVGVVLLPLITAGVLLAWTRDKRRALRDATLLFAGLEVVATLVSIVLASNVD